MEAWYEGVNEDDKKIEKFLKEEEKGEVKERAFTTLFYGDTATGKTYVAHTFPEPILIIDTENRAYNTKKYNFPNKKIDIFEPMMLRTKYFENMDLFDEHESIEIISKKVIDLLNSNEYRTVVIDSVTDLWTFIQQWMFVTLEKLYTKTGKKRGDMIQQRVENQLDWKLANRRHYDIVNALKSLNRSGTYVVFTAKEEVIPEYLKDEKNTTKNKIRCNKEIPFVADVTFQLKKEFKGGTWKYLAYCEKLLGLPIVNQPIENLNFEALTTLVNKQEKSLKGDV